MNIWFVNFIDRHSAFVLCENQAVKGEKFKVKIKIGEEYKHPDDFDHYISSVKLWNGEQMLAEANFLAGAQGGAPSQVEVDFFIVPTKTMKLLALAYCTKHGIWQSDEKIVEIEG